MKKWARVLTIISLVILIIILTLLFIIYFNLQNIQTSVAEGRISSNIVKYIVTIDMYSPLNSLFRWFVLLAIPSIVMFIIAIIFGREKKN